MMMYKQSVSSMSSMDRQVSAASGSSTFMQSHLDLDDLGEINRLTSDSLNKFRFINNNNHHHHRGSHHRSITTTTATATGTDDALNKQFYQPSMYNSNPMQQQQQQQPISYNQIAAMMDASTSPIHQRQSSDISRTSSSSYQASSLNPYGMCAIWYYKHKPIVFIAFLRFASAN